MRRLIARGSLWSLAVAIALLGTSAQGQDTVRKFDVGPGANAVGRVQTGEGAESDGPQAIYAGRNGEIYLLDQVNGRILNFDGKDSTSPTRSLVLPDDIEPKDMIVTDGNIIVWDGKPIVLDENGSGLTRSLALSRNVGAADENVLSMFGQLDAPELGGAEEAVAATRSIRQSREVLAPRTIRKSVATRGAGGVAAVFTPDGARTSMEISVISKTTQAQISLLALRTREVMGAVELLEIDTLGRSYVLVEVVPSSGMDGQTFVARFAQNSAFEGTYELPLSPDMSLVRRFVTVSPEGDVYFLRSNKGTVDVLGVGFTAAAIPAPAPPPEKGRRTKKGREPEVLYTQPPLSRRSSLPADFVNLRPAIGAVGPLTRQRVIETAFAFEGIKWRVTPANYGSDPDMSCSGLDRIRRPWYLRGAVGSEARGVPYCWGCSGSLAHFAKRISQGAVAGNVCTRDDPRRELAGVDCSAFVSATWGLSTHFTTAMIPSISSPVDPWGMKPGDALNKPNSHVMLFMGYTPDRRAQVIEAATGACNGKVCRNVYSLGALIERGYVPRRYRGLEGDHASAVIAPPGAALAGSKQDRAERPGERRDKSTKSKSTRAEASEQRGDRAAARAKGDDAPRQSSLRRGL